MSKNAIVGFGDLAKQLISLVLNDNTSDFICFDDIAFKADMENSLPFCNYNDSQFKTSNFYIALGYKNLRVKKDIIDELCNLNRTLSSYVHSTSFVNKSANIGKAVYIYPMCNIDKEVTIKTGSLINNSVVVSHNSEVGSSCYLSPGVILSGNVKIGDCTFIGSGTVVSNGVNIGHNVVIGPGSCITKDIKDNSHVIGNPQKTIVKSLKLI